MARPSKHDWAEIRRHYESGMTPSDIVHKFRCPRSTLSEKINSENWSVNEKANSVIKGIVSVSEEINELSEYDNQLARVATEIGQSKASKTLAVNTVAENLLVRINESIIQNRKVELVKVKTYLDGKVDGETVEPVEVAHGSSDHKAHADAIDRLAITLGVAERHAPKGDINVSANAAAAAQATVDTSKMSDSALRELIAASKSD
jgi:hypothetical protein